MMNSEDPKLNIVEEQDDYSVEKNDTTTTAGGHHDDDGTPNTFGRGIVKDVKATLGTWWLSEMINFQQKTIAVSFFMFFAAVAPAITFGAVYEKVTGHYIGAVEMIAATAWFGIVYALIGGSPPMINGGTGPVLAFVAVLYNLSGSLDVPFLTFYAWVGIWVMIYCVVGGFMDVNRMIKHATRFTDEVFAMLISLIFIINAFGNPFSPAGLYYYFTSDHSSHEEYEDDEDYEYTSVAFLSVILAIGTTVLAMQLKSMKFSPFLCNQGIRATLSDFAVTISIFVFVFIDHGLFSNIETEKLNVPDTFAPTFTCCDSSCTTYWPEDCEALEEPWGRRKWFIDLFDLNGKSWAIFFAAIPAALAWILIFLDHGITLHILNHPSHKLTHGVAYNYDSVIIGLGIGINSLVGMPWLVGATVRSLTHLHALAEKNAKGRFESVLETRLTGFFVHCMILGFCFALPVLKLIPVPILYGVFLYMGVTSLSTNQMWTRFLTFFMQPSKYPNEPFTEYVSKSQMHKFTAIQLALFVLLYAVQSISAIAIVFPIIIKICIPIRMYILPKFFTEQELLMLDGEDDEINEWIAKNNKDDGAVSVTEHASSQDDDKVSLEEA